MKINLQSVAFKADQKLIDFIEKRLSKLEQFYDKIISADIYLRLENTSEKENKIVEVRLNVPKEAIVVKKTATSFEEATDNCADSLTRKLRKINEMK